MYIKIVAKLKQFVNIFRSDNKVSIRKMNKASPIYLKDNSPDTYLDNYTPIKKK